MKNLKRTILGAAVVLIALGFSAFSAATVDSNYGKQLIDDQVHWIDLSGYTKVIDMDAPLSPGEYRCRFSTETCSAVFATQPPVDQPDPAVTEAGTLEIEP